MRNSNIELLRIIATVMVLLLHANFGAFAPPNNESILCAPTAEFFRTLLESACICCVNIFVFISGWFGIKLKAKSIVSFYFQCVFILALIYILAAVIGEEFSVLQSIKETLVLSNRNWFIKSYLLLMILSPILNSFAENTSRNMYKYVLIGFFTFQTIWGFLTGSAVFFEQGYSTMSFVGLYLLAKYLRIYPIKLAKTYYIVTYFIISLLIGCIAYFASKLGYYSICCHMFVYNNPLVILSGISLFLYFTEVKIQSSIINWVAISCFGVYLLHTHPLVLENLYESFFRNNAFINTPLCVLIITFTFTVGIIIDKMRIFVWNFCCKFI